MKNLIKKLLPQALRRKILIFLNHLWTGLCRRLPLKKRVCFYTIRADGKLLENAKVLCDALNCEKIIFAAKLPHSNIRKAKAYYAVLTSKVIVTDDYCRYLRVVRLREGQKVVQIWHGCGAFKKFALDADTDLTKEQELKTHSQYSLVAVTSEMSRGVFARAFGISEEVCVATGLPKTDIILNSAPEIRAELYGRHPELKDKSVYLYCPTFREKNRQRVKFDPGIDFDRLSASLSEDEVFIVCRHPMMDYEILEREYDNIKDMTDESTVGLVSVSSVLITDYSSVSHDAALFGVPTLFYCPDIDEYSRGFYLSFPDDLPGEMTRSPENLLDLIRRTKENPPLKRARKFRESQLGACDGQATPRLCEIITKMLD